MKNVSVNEDFSTGHFPGRPLLPAVLMIEALTQAAMKLGQAMYEQSQAQAQQTGGEAGAAEGETAGEQPGEEEVVDAEFSEVDENNKG